MSLPEGTGWRRPDGLGIVGCDSSNWRQGLDCPMLERWTRAIIRRRFLVIVLWAAVVLVGAFSMVRLPGLLSTSLAVPGTGSERANAILTQHFGENIEGTFTVVFNEANRSAPTAATARALDRRLAVAARAVPGGRASTLQQGAGRSVRQRRVVARPSKGRFVHRRSALCA